MTDHRSLTLQSRRQSRSPPLPSVVFPNLWESPLLILSAQRLRLPREFPWIQKVRGWGMTDDRSLTLQSRRQSRSPPLPSVVFPNLWESPALILSAQLRRLTEGFPRIQKVRRWGMTDDRLLTLQSRRQSTSPPLPSVVGVGPTPRPLSNISCHALSEPVQGGGTIVG